MVRGNEDTVAFRLWPPVAIGAPLLLGWLLTLVWGDPVDIGEWRTPVGWALVLFFVVWNSWSLLLFGRRETGLLPSQATHAQIEEGPFRLSATRYMSAFWLWTSGWRPSRQRSGDLSSSRPPWCSSCGVRSVHEERYLHERFGTQYDDYARRVRRWL